MQKSVTFKTKGMQRDLSVSAFNSEYAYENKNMRIVTTDNNTLFSLSNEKGTKLAAIEGIDSIEGTIIGEATIDDELVIFTSDETSTALTKKDKIYKITINGDVLSGSLLFEGNLSFSAKYPIEALPFYENKDIKKVYWTDGLNQPRVINISASSTVRSKWTNDSFDFIRSLSLQEEVSITRNTIAGGTFAPGVLQYMFTYFDKYSAESNIFYTSPLYYTSYNNRGASPEDSVSNSFNITINNAETKFDYIRIYSILRTSINNTPIAKKVVDLAIPSTGTITYVDTGTTGESIDPTELLYKGGEDTVFGTMTQKDNTLFLGNIEKKVHDITSYIKKFFKSSTVRNAVSITFNGKDAMTPPEPSGYYAYDNQLKFNSYQIKGFKYLEYYRIGIQAQHYTGKWSEPIWINDIQMTEHVKTTFCEGDDIYYPCPTLSITNTSILNWFFDNGYIKLRPVIVYPTINDREVICQGVLCPTVFNYGDRLSNSPFAQSSWFTRPYAPFDIYHSSRYQKDSSGFTPDYESLGQVNKYSKYSRAGILTNRKVSANINTGSTIQILNIDNVNKGSWAEFRHNRPIPSNLATNAEIQCIKLSMEPYVSNTATEDTITDYVTKYAENFGIDQSIVTMHSPDIEFDDEVKSIDSSNLKLRIVGAVPLTSFISDIDIQTSTPALNYANTSDVAPGFYKETVGVKNGFSYEDSDGNIQYGDSHFGWRGLMSGAFWLDEFDDIQGEAAAAGKRNKAFVVYPWHRNGSLNNTKYAKDGYRSAMLSKKRLSNLRYSYKTYFYDKGDVWNAYDKNTDGSDSATKTGISGVYIFDSNEISMLKIAAPKNSGLEDLSYYGNIDKLLTRYISPKSGGDKGDYPIVCTFGSGDDDDVTVHSIYTGDYVQVPATQSNTIVGIDPVRIKYKSTPHAVMALNHTTDGITRILPTVNSEYRVINDSGEKETIAIDLNTESAHSSTKPFWCKYNEDRASFDVLEFPEEPVPNVVGPQYGWLWLGELYNDNVQNRFGGQTDEALENNSWLPCGEAVSIANKSIIKTKVTLTWKEGDTYYQRYDHIKTYPFTQEDQNQVTDIVSFMCETRVNIDGRYDRNRGQLSNLAVTSANFNLVNDVYNQADNFFTYRALNPNKLNINTFSNTITWTKTKTLGELTDSWTNITLASTLDLDGNKGPVRALRRFNDSIIAFQDKGISQILYNSSVQIAATDGTPIEIANSGKVEGKRYVTDSVGCANKWSICETPNGIYFIDDIIKGIYIYNGQINSLSDKLGFHTWISKSLNNVSMWNPVDFNNFVTYYDKINKEVLFISKDTCLSYSELISQFTSFYSYENTPYFINLQDKGIWSRNNTLWLHNEGDYNKFFGTYQPFYTTVIANPDNADKVFNTIEFRADSWDNNDVLLNTTFDTLSTWNEYQQGTSSLVNTKDKPSSLKRKFRIWRANIPRDKSNGRDRMRNPWLYLKLSMEGENINRTILHDITLNYFE